MVKFENQILLGDCRNLLKELDNNSIDTCITSPPYWGCRDYGIDDQIGIEENPFDYVDELVKIFALVKEKLTPKGNLWIIIDDVWVSNWTRCRQHTWISSKDDDHGISNEYIQDKCKIQRNWSKALGLEWLKAKQKLLLPERMIIRMQEEQNWFFREKLIWFKPNAGNYTNIHDRFAHAYEYVLHFTKEQYYFVNMDAIKEQPDGKLKRDVLSIPIERSASQHSAVFPKALIKILLEFSCPPGGVVLDPFCGTGTTLIVAKNLGHSYIGIELSPDYHKVANDSIEMAKKGKISSKEPSLMKLF
ncbi:MAG TPA: site-specific DNA-methyltransferase [Candidatus Lokiarchaeia archaeon]|nr:site-specific DNA-methyltransferase [Candidatus Lokiarchaeia archaeon]